MYVLYLRLRQQVIQLAFRAEAPEIIATCSCSCSCFFLSSCFFGFGRARFCRDPYVNSRSSDPYVNSRSSNPYVPASDQAIASSASRSASTFSSASFDACT